jgi:hypothetical protein
VGTVGPWCSFYAAKLVVRASVVERSFAGPDALDNAPPFFALCVALVVLVLRNSEHLELVLVPATNNVDAEAALANMVRCGHLLGGDERMMQGDVDGAEHVEAPRHCQQAAGPGNRFKAGAVGV